MSRAEPLLLGLDVGTTQTKAVLLDAAGHERQVAAVTTPFAASSQGTEATAEQLRQSLTGLLTSLGPDRRRVAAVGIAGMAESGAPIDRQGRALAPVIAWHDPRGADVVARLDERFGPDLHLSIGQRLRTVSSVAKLGWLLDQGVSGVGSWLGVPELYLHGLTGRIATEFSLAARTGCYDVGQRRYLPSVMAALGVGAEVFPAVAAAGSVMGRVSAAGAQWSGLPEGAAVTIAGHDHLVGSLGSGARPSDLANSVGTAETVVAGGRGLPDLDLALSLRVAVTVMPEGKKWAMLASAARSGIVLAATADALGCSIQELDGLAGAAGAFGGGAGAFGGGAGGGGAGAFVRGAGGGGAAVGGAGGGTGGPDIGELLERIERREAIGAIPGPPAAVWDRMLRALAARTWDAADRVGRVAGPSRRLVVFGGGSRSRRWLSIKAEQVAMAVWCSSATEAVARGAALYAGVAAGWWPSVDRGPQADLELIDPPADPGAEQW